MNKYLYLVCGGILLWTGCKENHELVSLAPAVMSVDSTYMVSPVPAADLHNVLVEEFTGQSCSNCPSKHTLLEGIASANPGRVNIMGLYIFGFPQANPVAGSVHDLRDSVATTISNVIYGGVSAEPSGGIDRLAGSAGGLISYSPDWSSEISSRLSAPDSVNLSVTSTYDASTNKATIKVKVIYVQPVTAKQCLSVAIVEDSTIDKQEEDTTIVQSYVFTNVFRGMASATPFGDPILDSLTTKTAGRAYERTYIYTPKTITPPVNPYHCRVIAFVNCNATGDYHVMQSAQCKLTP